MSGDTKLISRLAKIVGALVLMLVIVFSVGNYLRSKSDNKIEPVESGRLALGTDVCCPIFLPNCGVIDGVCIVFDGFVLS